MTKLHTFLFTLFLISGNLKAHPILIGIGSSDTTISRKLKNGLNAEYLYKNNTMVAKAFYFRQNLLSSYKVTVESATDITIESVFYNDSIFKLYKLYSDTLQRKSLVDNSDTGIAQFIGGQAVFSEFLENNLNYPESSKVRRKNGIAVVEFVVSKEGIVKKIQCPSKIDSLLIKEAMRVILLTDGHWAPMTLNVMCRIPITFELD